MSVRPVGARLVVRKIEPVPNQQHMCMAKVVAVGEGPGIPMRIAVNDRVLLEGWMRAVETDIAGEYVIPYDAVAGVLT